MQSTKPVFTFQVDDIDTPFHIQGDNWFYIFSMNASKKKTVFCFDNANANANANDNDNDNDNDIDKAVYVNQ